MTRGMRILRRNIFAIITIVAIVPVVAIDLFGIEIAYLPDDLTLNMILVALGGIAAAVISIDHSSLVQSFSETNRKINEVLLLSRGRIAAVRPSQNASIWHDFKGVFYAVNPPLKLLNTSDESYEEMVESHAARFANPDFKVAYYIFFTHGAPGRYFPTALENFIRFSKDIRAVTPEIEKKLRVIISDSEAPGFSFFLGQKEIETSEANKDVSYSIFYSNEVPLTSKSGFPNWCFISTDDEFNSTLKDFGSAFMDCNTVLSYKDACAYRPETASEQAPSDS